MRFDPENDDPREYVTARLIEAAGTERRLPSDGTRPYGCNGYWPDYKHSFAEMAEWGAERLKEHREDAFAAMGEKRAAIPAGVTRLEECLVWIMRHIRRPEDRKAVAAWAQAKAGGKPFRVWCRENGLHQRTGQRRVHSGIGDLARLHHCFAQSWSDFAVGDTSTISGK